MEAIVETQGLTKRYRGVAALEGCTLVIQRGEVFGLLGPNGAGKTTLLRLLLRFYAPQRGRVLLDGEDVAGLELSWLRRQMALVLQEPIIFSSSLGENIAYGRPGASPAEIVQASRAAGLDEYVADLPAGYETRVGERGVRLSGGQRQRLAIARAFLKDAPILILDEPTSNLDATTEQHVFGSLERLARGRTTLVIAHRLATAQRADRIVVLDAGRIVEQGTHHELLAAGGSYARLCRDQTVGSPVADLAGMSVAE
jgi:ATP-binding cassette subfamily B protein